MEIGKILVNAQEVNPSRYDAIIAGSGPAGAVVAKQMASLDKTVLVIESGGRDFDASVQERYAIIHGQGHFDSDYWPNHWVRALGGTSSAWQGWVAPLTARNMTSWPISHTEIENFYRVAAVELGRNPLISEWSLPTLYGFALKPFSRGEPARYGEDAGWTIWDSENVHVLLNASLSRLFPRQDRKAIERIEIFAGPGENLTFEVPPTKQIVLAAGGMGNAQILLASDDGLSSAVGNETDQVGRYLMEHPHFYNCARVVVRDDFALPNPPPEFGEFSQALVPDDSAYTALGELDASFELVESPVVADDAIERFIVNRLGGSAKALRVNARTEMAPDRENRVERIHGNDPAGLPRLRATCVFNASDYRVPLGYLRRLGESLASQNIGRVQIQNQSLFFDATGGGHTMGTTRMGNDPATSVTDRDCRVHGYENLFVAGSSLFPTGGYANPTLTIVALAVRLGNFLGSKA